MKNIVIVFALFMSMAASAEKLVVENNIPQNVTSRFHYQFPKGYKDMITYHLDGDLQFENIIAIDDFSGSPYYVIDVIKNNKKYTYELSLAEGEDVILCDLRQGTVVW